MVVLPGCATQSTLPEPRTLVVHSGARLHTTAERMEEVDAWVTAVTRTIVEDPSFLLITDPQGEGTYPWETLEVNVNRSRIDTVQIQVAATSPDSWTPYRIYAFLHLMAERGEVAQWLPGVDSTEVPTGYALERVILSNVSDSWLYGRSIWVTAPFAPLDELIYANENGYLDAFVLTARPEEFSEAREAWLEANPGRLEEYREWFQETFDRPPPGLRTGG